MSSLLRCIVVGLGLCGAGSALYHRLQSPKPPPQENKELIRLAAVALSSDVVTTVLLRDEDTLKLLKSFLKNAFLEPDVVSELKCYAKEELTMNKETVSALRKFIVKDIICDAWVADELINEAKVTGREIIGDPVVYPELSLGLLGSAAKEALHAEVFKDALVESVWSSIWLAFLGPPPDHLRVRP